MKTTTSCTPNRTDLEAARQAALRALEQLCRARGISIPAELRLDGAEQVAFDQRVAREREARFAELRKPAGNREDR